MYKTCDLYDPDHTYPEVRALLDSVEYPFEALEKIGQTVLEIGRSLPEDEYCEIGEHVWAANDAVIDPKATLHGPAVIGHETEVRPGAFIRGNAIVGNHAVVGNSTELKNVILFDNVQVPHFNYVGDAILGFHAHLGAGAITSNVRADRKPVVMKDGSETLPTGRKKVGAFLGDFAEIGCNAVLNPGTVIGRNSIVYPLTNVRGTVKENCILKNDGRCVPITR